MEMFLVGMVIAMGPGLALLLLFVLYYAIVSRHDRHDTGQRL